MLQQDLTNVQPAVELLPGGYHINVRRDLTGIRHRFVIDPLHTGTLVGERSPMRCVEMPLNGI